MVLEEISPTHINTEWGLRIETDTITKVLKWPKIIYSLHNLNRYNIDNSYPMFENGLRPHAFKVSKIVKYNSQFTSVHNFCECSTKMENEFNLSQIDLT